MNVKFEVTFSGGIGRLEIETTAKGGAKGGSGQGGGGTKKLVFTTSGTKSLDLAGDQVLTIGGSSAGGAIVEISWLGMDAMKFTFAAGPIAKISSLPLSTNA